VFVFSGSQQRESEEGERVSRVSRASWASRASSISGHTRVTECPADAAPRLV
jgi:hypothetical protein